MRTLDTLARTTTLFTVVLLSVGGAACVDEPRHGSTTAQLTDDEVVEDEAQQIDDGDTCYDDGSGDYDPAAVFGDSEAGAGMERNTPCTNACDAAFEPGLFHGACILWCRGADSAIEACSMLRSCRAPRGWVAALKKICAIVPD